MFVVLLVNLRALIAERNENVPSAGFFVPTINPEAGRAVADATKAALASTETLMLMQEIEVQSLFVVVWLGIDAST